MGKFTGGLIVIADSVYPVNRQNRDGNLDRDRIRPDLRLSRREIGLTCSGEECRVNRIEPVVGDSALRRVIYQRLQGKTRCQAFPPGRKAVGFQGAGLSRH